MSSRALIAAACAGAAILATAAVHAREPESPSSTPKAALEPAAAAAPARSCAELWPVSKVCTIGKGQGPSSNATLSHCITGNIVNPTAIGANEQRIPVCRGTEVTIVVTDASGTPTNSSEGSLTCNAASCTGVVSRVEKYKSVSQDGKDTDRITLLPN